MTTTEPTTIVPPELVERVQRALASVGQMIPKHYLLMRQLAMLQGELEAAKPEGEDWDSFVARAEAAGVPLAALDAKKLGLLDVAKAGCEGNGSTFVAIEALADTPEPGATEGKAEDLNILGTTIPAGFATEVAAITAEVRALATEVRPILERATEALGRADELSSAVAVEADVRAARINGAGDDAHNLVAKLTGALELNAALHDLVAQAEAGL